MGEHLAVEPNAHVKVAGRSMVARYGVEPIES